MSQINKIASLAGQINEAIETEILDTQRRLHETVQSLIELTSISDMTIMPPIQRNALKESLELARKALVKIENAWNLPSIQTVLTVVKEYTPIED